MLKNFFAETGQYIAKISLGKMLDQSFGQFIWMKDASKYMNMPWNIRKWPLKCSFIMESIYV